MEMQRETGAKTIYAKHGFIRAYSTTPTQYASVGVCLNFESLAGSIVPEWVDGFFSAQRAEKSLN